MKFKKSGVNCFNYLLHNFKHNDDVSHDISIKQWERENNEFVRSLFRHRVRKMRCIIRVRPRLSSFVHNEVVRNQKENHSTERFCDSNSSLRRVQS